MSVKGQSAREQDDLKCHKGLSRGKGAVLFLIIEGIT